VRSLTAYGLHVLTHKVPWLWRIHRVHHADVAVDLSTGFRHHPAELVFVGACHAAVAVALGLSVPALCDYRS
jgi:sterol desaturase/sphingolipid hydroxylase (fatty acid hydroxylase superfamily)